jgi:tetraacyldisaccharide 4'-kinase
MKYLRYLLLPFSLFYGLVVIIRNWCYDAGVLKSTKFNIPVISVGNLEVGGAGKSPMTEYLVRLLKNNPDSYRGKVATLSRGYGRKTKGYVECEYQVSSIEREYQVSSIKYQEASDTDSPNTPYLSTFTFHLSPLTNSIGDEPAQFKRKFPDITVAVCEKRVEGIKKLLPGHNVIILDDAYQHRAVEPGLSILLFDYSGLNSPHWLLPAGNFREPFSGRWRAQIIIITKCPQNLTADEQAELAQKIMPLPYQQVFFTAIGYGQLGNLDGTPSDFVIDGDTTVFLLTGIANAKPLLAHLKTFTAHISHHNYPDHHAFTLKNIAKLADEFLACTDQKKIIITTEKDSQRLQPSWFNRGFPGAETLPVLVWPIHTVFLNGGGQRFNQLIIDYVREHSAINGLH